MKNLFAPLIIWAVCKYIRFFHFKFTKDISKVQCVTNSQSSILWIAPKPVKCQTFHLILVKFQRRILDVCKNVYREKKCKTKHTDSSDRHLFSNIQEYIRIIFVVETNSVKWIHIEILVYGRIYACLSVFNEIDEWFAVVWFRTLGSLFPTTSTADWKSSFHFEVVLFTFIIIIRT